MAYKALGFTITPSSLGDWGKYVKALSERNIPVTAVVTNITFDATVSYPKVNFAFGRFLSPEEFALVQKRSDGEDVQAIVSPRAGAVPALPGPRTASARAAGYAASRSCHGSGLRTGRTGPGCDGASSHSDCSGLRHRASSACVGAAES
jgi:hypothetical protein